jgi:uncharacterized protein
LLRLAAVVYGVAAILWLLVGIVDLAGTPSPPSVSADVVATLSEGSWTEVVALQFWYWTVTLAILAVIQGPAVFASFLVGVAIGRTDLLAQPGGHLDLARRVLRWAPLPAVWAAVGAWLTVAGGRGETLGFAIGFAAAPGLTAAYMAALALALERGWNRLSRVLQASGRMSLTVYLLESVVVSTLSYGYGVGLFGDVGPAAGVLLAVTVWLGLSAFSVGWMRLFRFGPFEWALRSFTYRARQPLR